MGVDGAIEGGGSTFWRELSCATRRGGVLGGGKGRNTGRRYSSGAVGAHYDGSRPRRRRDGGSDGGTGDDGRLCRRLEYGKLVWCCRVVGQLLLRPWCARCEPRDAPQRWDGFPSLRKISVRAHEEHLMFSGARFPPRSGSAMLTCRLGSSLGRRQYERRQPHIARRRQVERAGARCLG